MHTVPCHLFKCVIFDYFFKHHKGHLRYHHTPYETLLNVGFLSLRWTAEKYFKLAQQWPYSMPEELRNTCSRTFLSSADLVRNPPTKRFYLAISWASVSMMKAGIRAAQSTSNILGHAALDFNNEVSTAMRWTWPELVSRVEISMAQRCPLVTGFSSWPAAQIVLGNSKKAFMGTLGVDASNYAFSAWW